MGRISQLYLPGNYYDIGTAAKIYARQCSSTVRTLIEADGDITKIIQTAEKAKLNKKQREALREYKDKREDFEIEQHLWDEEAARNSAAILQTLNKKAVSMDDLQKWKQGEDERKYQERLEHWQALSMMERGTENDG